MIQEEIDSSLEDIIIIPYDERHEYWFDDGISLADLCDDEDFSVCFQFDKAKWQGKEGKVIEDIIVLDDFIYSIGKEEIPLVVFGFGINLINQWILLTMQEYKFNPKSSHFKSLMLGVA